MKKIYKKILAIICTIFSNVISFLIFMQLINVIDVRMLKAGYIEGGGASQFTRVYLGIPLFLFVAIAWLGFALFSFRYYEKGEENNTLLRRFSLVTSIELYLIPVLVLIYHIAFPMNMISTDWILTLIGLLGGSIGLFFYKKRTVN